MPGTKGPLWGEKMLEGTGKEGTVTSPYDIITFLQRKIVLSNL